LESRKQVKKNWKLTKQKAEIAGKSEKQKQKLGKQKAGKWELWDEWDVSDGCEDIRFTIYDLGRPDILGIDE
jgi:hypothetical protein